MPELNFNQAKENKDLYFGCLYESSENILFYYLQTDNVKESFIVMSRDVVNLKPQENAGMSVTDLLVFDSLK